MLDGSKWGKKKDEGYMSASDEEILPLQGLSEDEDEEEDEDDDEEVSDGQDDDRSLLDEDEREEEELDKEAWGSSRKAYYYIQSQQVLWQVNRTLPEYAQHTDTPQMEPAFPPSK